MVSIVKTNYEEEKTCDDINFFDDLTGFLRKPNLEKLMEAQKNTVEISFSKKYKLILNSLDKPNLDKKSLFSVAN